MSEATSDHVSDTLTITGEDSTESRASDLANLDTHSAGDVYPAMDHNSISLKVGQPTRTKPAASEAAAMQVGMATTRKNSAPGNSTDGMKVVDLDELPGNGPCPREAVGARKKAEAASGSPLCALNHSNNAVGFQGKQPSPPMDRRGRTDDRRDKEPATKESVGTEKHPD